MHTFTHKPKGHNSINSSSILRGSVAFVPGRRPRPCPAAPAVRACPPQNLSPTLRELFQ